MMSRQKASAIPFDPNSNQPHVVTRARLSGLGGPPELPLSTPPRNIRNESTTTARTACGLFSRAEAEGLTRTIKNDREKSWSPPTRAIDSSTTPSSYNQMLRQNDSAQRLVSASVSELLATGEPMSLKEFSKGKNVRDLPCLVKVVAGHCSLCECYTFGTEQILVFLEKKSMHMVTCKDHKGGISYAVPLNTAAFYLVPHWMDAMGILPNRFGGMTADELLQSKALPPVIAVSEEFEISKHHSKKTVPVGTLLFPKERKQSKDRRQWVLHAKSESGETVQITPACNGHFSILACDVRLTLRQALDHLKPPFTMRAVSDCDTLYVSVVTVESMHEEDVFIGMMKTTEGTLLNDATSFSHMVEVPVSFNLTVVTMVPKQQEILDQIYDFAQSEYHRVIHHQVNIPSKPADTVQMTPNPVHMVADCMTAKFKSHPTSSVTSAPSMPLARTLPNTPLQVSVAAPNDRNEHIYDTIDNYTASHTVAMCTHQMVPSHDSEGTGTVFRSDRPPYDAVEPALDYYEATDPSSPDPKGEGVLIGSDQPPPYTAAVLQKVSSDSEAAGTPIKSDQPPSEDILATSMKQDGSVEDTHANISYLKTMQRGDILQLLDAMNLSVYKEAFEQEQIDGEMMSCLSADMLGELGVSKALHRLRLMKIISGQTTAAIGIPHVGNSSV